MEPRICKICNKEFIPKSWQQIYCKELHYRICPICGKSYAEPNLDKFKYPPTTCSMECRVKKRAHTSLNKYGISAPGNNPDAREKSKKTMQERYGVDYAQQSDKIKQKSIDTWINKYGVDNPQKATQIKEKTRETNIQKYGSNSYLNSEVGKKQIDNIMLDKYGTTVPLRNPDIKQKCIDTNIQKYGAACPLSNNVVQEKAKETSRRNYGTDHPMSSDVVKQRVKDTFIRNYGVDNCFKSQKVITKIKDSFFRHYGVHSVMEAEEISKKIQETNKKKYGVPYYIMLPNVAKSSGRISNINKTILDKLRAAGIYGQLEYTINDQSYDIYIQQGNTAIEINPTYTHNTIGNHWNHKGIDKNYHLKKTINAINAGYRCLHLWDWDNVSKFINLMTIKNVIYDQLQPELIDVTEAENFINQYSLYDITKNLYGILFLGIRYKSKLMLLMGFKLSDPILNTWTLVCVEQRFNYTIHNGNTILLNYFISQYHPNKIISYADFSKSNGELLENLGFNYTRFILPNKIWSKGRHAITDSPNIIADAMIHDRWLPVYDCGYKVYEKICIQ